MRRFSALCIALPFIWGLNDFNALTIGTATAAEPAKDVAAQRKQAIDRGLKYLKSHGQAEDGTFSIKAGPGLTALALTAALRIGRAVDDPMVSKGLKTLEGFVKPDGGIYGSGRVRNYETCVSIVCFQLAKYYDQPPTKP